MNAIKNFAKNNLTILAGDFNVDNNDYKLTNFMKKYGLYDTNESTNKYTFINYFDNYNNEIIKYKPFICKKSYEYHCKRARVCR